MSLFPEVVVLIAAYALGSIPTAVVYSRLAHGKDIRDLGDGNMGARNTKRQFGLSAGVMVACFDILKGTLAVLLAKAFQMPLEQQLMAGTAVILGHDFPVFAGFKGGQGFAATTGVFLGLFPLPTLIGTVIYFLLYALFHNSDLAAAFGMGQGALHVTLNHEPLIAIAFLVLALLFVPFKKWLDRSRRTALRRSWR